MHCSVIIGKYFKVNGVLFFIWYRTIHLVDDINEVLNYLVRLHTLSFKFQKQFSHLMTLFEIKINILELDYFKIKHNKVGEFSLNLKTVKINSVF